jgi:lipopolysaccharide exporter
VLSAAIYSLILRFSVPVFGVLNFMLLVRIFNESEVGIWVLFTTIITLIEVSKSGFIRNASVRLLSLSDEQTSVINASFVVNVLFTVACIVCIGIASVLLTTVWSQQQLAILLGLFCVQLIVFIFFSHMDYQISSNVNFKVMMVAYMIRNGSLFIFLAVIYWFGTSITLEWLAVAQIACLLLATIYLLFRFRPISIQWNVEKKSIMSIVSFGKYVFATNTCSMLFRSTDHYMLASLLSNASVAYYNVALRITNLIDLPSTAASEVLFPVSVKNLKDKGKEDLKRLFEKTVGYTLVIVIPLTIFCFVFAKPIILIIAGEGYLSSIPVLQVTLAYGLLLPYLKQLGTILNVMNKPHVGFYLMLFIFLFNIGTNYFFIHRFGMIGAAYGTLISYVVSIIINQAILQKELNVNFLSTFRYYILAHKELFEKAKTYASRR